MVDISFIRSIGIMVVAASVVVMVARRLNMPTIVAYIVTGLILGPVLGLMAMVEHAPQEEPHAESKPVEQIAEAGIALLLFIVGLELSLAKIRDVGKVALVAGTGQVVFTALVGFLISLGLQFSFMESIFLATALTFSSTVVVVKLLDQKKEMNSLYGRLAVGIFLVQDMIVIFVLTFLAGLGSPETFQFSQVAMNLLMAFLGMALLLAVALVVSKYLLPRPFAWAAQSPPTLFIWSLCLCFLFVEAARALKLSAEVGAFLAGLSLAQLDCSHQLRRRVHPLMNFFIMIFFITLGAQMNPGDALRYWPSAIVLSLFVLIGKSFIFMVILPQFGYSERTSFFTSVTVAQISEFSFILAAVGLSAGLIDRPILSLITMMGLITIALSAYMILYNQKLYDYVRRWNLLRPFRAGSVPENEDQGDGDLVNHIVIVGMNALGRQLAPLLHERGETVLAIDTDQHKLRGLPCRTMVGNVDDLAMLEEARLAQAKLAISTLQIEDTNNLFAYRCRKMGVPSAIHAFDASVIGDLQRLEVDFLIDARRAGSARFEQELKKEGVLPA